MITEFHFSSFLDEFPQIILRVFRTPSPDDLQAAIDAYREEYHASYTPVSYGGARIFRHRNGTDALIFQDGTGPGRGFVSDGVL